MRAKLVLLLLLSRAALAQELHQMVLNSAADKVRQQATLGANLDQQDVNGDTPLHWAVQAGRTPLFRAAEMGQTEVVGWLLERGASPRSPNHIDQTAPRWWTCFSTKAPTPTLSRSLHLRFNKMS